MILYLVLLFVLLVVLLKTFSRSYQLIGGNGILGGRLFSTGKPIKITVDKSKPFRGGQIWLLEPERHLLLDSLTDQNKSVTVTLAPWSELVLGVRPRDEEVWFRTGLSEANPDGHIHAKIFSDVGGDSIKVGFMSREISEPNNLSFDDIVIRLEGGVSLTRPRFLIEKRTVVPVKNHRHGSHRTHFYYPHLFANHQLVDALDHWLGDVPPSPINPSRIQTYKPLTDLNL